MGIEIKRLFIAPVTDVILFETVCVLTYFDSELQPTTTFVLSSLHFWCVCSYKNRPDMTFDDVACEADQEFEMHPDSSGSIEYITK